MMVDWEQERRRGERIRATEVWLASPEGLEAMEPFERIKRLEAGNAKLRKKLERMSLRAKPAVAANEAA